MGWEPRGNRSYYYRKRREGESIISEYVGYGFLGESAEMLQVMTNERRLHERLERRAERRVHEVMEEQIEQFAEELKVYLSARLIADGCHRHKREWRRRRERGSPGGI